MTILKTQINYELGRFKWTRILHVITCCNEYSEWLKGRVGEGSGGEVTPEWSLKKIGSSQEEEGAEGMEMRIAETMPHATGDAMWPRLREESLRCHVKEF